MATTRKRKEKDLIDQLLDQIDLKSMSREEILGQQRLLKQLTGQLLGRALDAEMDEHLGYVGLKSANIPATGTIPGTAETATAKRPF
jgi:hypothetical protein